MNCPRCRRPLDDLVTHWREPGSYALYCMDNAFTPRERYLAVTRQMRDELYAGEINPVDFERRLASAARAFTDEMDLVAPGPGTGI